MTNKKNSDKRKRMNRLLRIRLICVAFFFTIFSVPGHALTPTQVFDKVRDTVVVVKTLDTEGKLKAQGSGVLVLSGRVATNCHVVEGGISYRVGRGDRLVSATLYAEDADKDICILTAKGVAGKSAQLGKATNLKVGDPVYAVGAPKGLELSLSDGIVAQLRGGLPPLIQTTAAISPGSSGGGLFDGEGRLVGLTTLYVEGGQSLNFAMPVEWVNDVKPGRKPTAQGTGQTEWVKRGLALQNMKDWHGLLDWCLKWTQSDPENADAWYSLGVVYDNLNRKDDAIQAYRQSIRIDQNRAYTWYNLGVSYSFLNRYDDAIQAYRQAVRINPEHSSAWYNLGIAYYNLNRKDDAIQALRQAVRINPENSPAWYNLGVSYSSLNRYDDAIQAYRQAVRINPEHTKAWYNLGIAYTISGNRTAALNIVQELRRLDPQIADALFNQIVPR
jgi:cytochrome c-type biogenesis protein CcmH/NrfG